MDGPDGHGHGHCGGLLKMWLESICHVLKTIIAGGLGESRRDFSSCFGAWKVSRRLWLSFSHPTTPAPAEMRVGPCKKDAMAQGDGGLICTMDFPFPLDLCLANRHGRHFPSLACARHHQSEGPFSARTLGWSHPG